MSGLTATLPQVLQRAFAAHQAGNAAEAERLYKRVIRAVPDQFDALHLLGVLKAERGFPGEADRLIRKALEVNPRSAEALNNRANVLQRLKRWDEALASCDKALAIKPDFAEALNNRGSVLHDLKRYDEALESLERSLAIQPRNFKALNNLGMVLLEVQRTEEALASFDRALAIKPGLAEVWNNRGNALRALQRNEEALASYEKSLEIQPRYVKALSNRGNLLHDLMRDDEALASLNQALVINPDLGEAHYHLAKVLLFTGQRAECEAQYERALALDPDLIEARFGLCMAQLPIVYRSEAEIIERRAAYEDRLRRLSDAVDQGRATGDLMAGLGSHMPFYLAYQGRNDLELQRLYGSLACRIMGDRYPPAPISGRAGPGERIRVGIVSAYFRHHSVWKMPIKGWLSQLDRGQFRIYGYHIGTERDRATELAASLCERFVQGPLSIDRWRKEIVTDAPHVLIYPDIGMDGQSVQLAGQRLALIQCNSWGHPVTSGMPTVDYYLSSDLMEPPDGQEHYTERLIRLPNLSVYYEPVEVKTIPVDRAQLGLRATAPVFWCAQSLYKYLPQYDQVFPRIARQLGDCQFVFVPYRTGTAVTEIFQQRLRDAFARFGLSAGDHCVFLPRLDQDRYVAAIGQCDVFLDSISWSGCNSTLESLAHDLPIVTLRGDLMRGRHTAAILERMGVTETITDTVEDYISAAVRLGGDVSWRNAIKARIAGNKHRIYRDRACISALEEFLERAARGVALPTV